MLAIVKPAEQSAPDVATFDDFWLLYPRRVAKREAEKVWARMSSADRMAAVVAMVDWRRVWLARGDDRYTPHASSWLNGARWEDELPSEFVATPMHGSHVAAKLPEVGAMSVMPEKVRAALAKLRGRS